MSVVKVRFGKIGFVAMVCGIAMMAPGAGFAAGPEFSPLPMPRAGSDARADAVISQSAPSCDGASVACVPGLSERAPAGRNFGRSADDIDGGGDDRGGKSAR